MKRVFYVRIKRCGLCACGYMSIEKDVDPDIVSVPALLTSSDDTLEKADMRVGAALRTVRGITHGDE